MLTPTYLATCTNTLLGMYDELDRAIIADIVRRIVKTGEITKTAKIQLERIQQSGMLLEEVTQRVAAATSLTEEEVKRLYEEAGVKGIKNDAKTLIANGVEVDLTLSEDMNNVLTATIAKTQGDLRNLTMTLGATATNKYLNAVNQAYMKVESGAFSYTEAIKTAIRQSSVDGNWVTYASGARSQLDVAVRRSVLTGINQTSAKITEAFGKSLDCEYYEVSAHAGARPSHAEWQGQVYKIVGADKYPNFVDSTGYGTGEGLCGWNCRHSFHPYFPQYDTPSYSKSELESYDAKSYTYNGQQYSEYEITQLMRSNERSIRETKRFLVGLKSGMENTSSQDLKDSLNEEFTKQSVRLSNQRARYSDLCSQTKMREDSSRTSVTAYKDQYGNIVSFGRSVAQKAVWANRTAK